jgi:hypothetical protein
MNLLILLAALLPWAVTPVAAFTRIFIAVSVLSIEMQLVTWLRIGSLSSLVVLNVLVAAAIVAWQVARKRPVVTVERQAMTPPVPLIFFAGLAIVVLVLNAALPLRAADPYHLERVEQIERLGTLEFDPAVAPKINIVGWLYELVLADVRQVPFVGPAAVKLHGVFGLLLYGLTLATVFTMLKPPRARWPVVALLVVPVVFHQFVLIKNDLFIAAPALVALAWLVASGGIGARHDMMWAGWLLGLVAGYKLTNLPLVLLAGGAVVVATRARDLRPLMGLAAGVAIGIVTSGLLLTLWQNATWYGDPFASGPVEEMGGRTSGAAEAAESVTRFGLSLVDLGQLTPRWWPGRGGWGGTFGLPFIWAVAVLLLYYGQAREARWTLAFVALHFIAFAGVFPDADLAQRLALAPGLLVIAVALHLLDRPQKFAGMARRALVPVLILSGAQIVRSAVLYMTRG